ncbi:MAG: HAMP domain-containing protein [Dehalococcoidia bacterium]|nr:HAMP domain-containing protein [Dehalococcoidia bacterium]
MPFGRIPVLSRLPRPRVLPRSWRFSVRAKLWAISGATVILSVLVALVGWASLRESNDAANTAINEGARLEYLAQEIEATRLAMANAGDSMVNDIYVNGAAAAASTGSSEYNQFAVRLRGDVNLAESLVTDETLTPVFTTLTEGLRTLDTLYYELGEAVKQRGDTETGAEGDLRRAAATLGDFFQFDSAAISSLRRDTRTSQAATLAELADAPDDTPVEYTVGAVRDSLQATATLLDAGAQEAATLALAEVRTAEKDFILRQNAAYATEVSDGVTALKTRIAELGYGPAAESQILGATDAYLAAFEAYAEGIAGVQSVQSRIDATMDSIAAASQQLARFGTSARDDQIGNLEATVSFAQKALMAAALGAFILGAAGTIWLIRTISPLKRVTDAALAISRGDLEQEVTHDSNDEIGDLGRAMRGTIEYVNEMATAANRIAEGDVSLEVEPRGDRDVLGNAFGRMQDYLRRGVAAAGEIAGGNLAVDIRLAGDRDVLGQALVEMRDSINLTLLEASRAAEALAEAKDELVRVSDDSARTTQDVARAADQVAAGTQEQAKGIDRVAENMAELSGAVSQVAAGAEEQRELLEEAASLGQQVAGSASGMSSDAHEVAVAASMASDVAKSGAERVGRTVDNIHRLKTSMDGAGEAVSELGARSSEIGKIVGVIRDIAAQTDLLALNAAIEAARAGEHGAGFAVVADEVRSLAARATAATKDISKLILDVQEGVERAVNAMHAGATEMQTGIGSASEAGEALSQILGSVEAVDERIRGIAQRATELQTSGERMVEHLQSIRAVADQNSEAAEGMRNLSVGVEEAAGSIASIAEENSASAEETSASAEAMSAQVEQIHASTVELGNMADALRSAIARFRLVPVDGASITSITSIEDSDTSEELAAA